MEVLEVHDNTIKLYSDRVYDVKIDTKLNISYISSITGNRFLIEHEVSENAHRWLIVNHDLSITYLPLPHKDIDFFITSQHPTNIAQFAVISQYRNLQQILVHLLVIEDDNTYTLFDIETIGETSAMLIFPSDPYYKHNTLMYYHERKGTAYDLYQLDDNSKALFKLDANETIIAWLCWLYLITYKDNIVYVHHTMNGERHIVKEHVTSVNAYNTLFIPELNEEQLAETYMIVHDEIIVVKWIAPQNALIDADTPINTSMINYGKLIDKASRISGNAFALLVYDNKDNWVLYDRQKRMISLRGKGLACMNYYNLQYLILEAEFTQYVSKPLAHITSEYV